MLDSKQKEGMARSIAYSLYIKYAHAGIWFQENFGGGYKGS
jgi:hypothetical protein